MSRPRILIFTEEFLSPSMTFIARQIDALQSRFQVSVLCRIRRNVDLFPFGPVEIVPAAGLERLGARARGLCRGRHWEIGGLRSRAFKDAILRRKPDLIHAHFGPSGLAILPFAVELGIPLVTTFHGFDASSLLARRVYRRDLGKLFEYSEIVTVSQEMRRALIACGANPARTHCQYIGVPLSSFPAPKRRTVDEKRACHEMIVFLQVSNFVEKKGHEYTVRAFAKLVDEFPDCRLLFAGSGPMMPRIEGLVSELGLGGCVKFLGHQNSQSVAELMRDADFFVHHSVTSTKGDKEGIPTVLMEAMATGLLVISTRHSGIPELIDHDWDGLLVGERDITGYVHAMIKALNDKSNLGTRARTKVEGMFDIDACTRGLGDLYDWVLVSKRDNQPYAESETQK